MTPREALDLGLAELRLALPEATRMQLMNYVTLLAEWNRTYNLTAIDDPLRMVSHDLLDSLVVIPHLPMTGDTPRLADAGSGAGLPGIPLALARPGWRVTLAEASEKKTAFLRQAALELGLRNVDVHHGRVEQWRPAQLFSVVISRAFAGLARFTDLCCHLVAPGGTLAAMTGAKPTNLGSHCKVVSLSVPLLDAQRHLALCPTSSP